VRYSLALLALVVLGLAGCSDNESRDGDAWTFEHPDAEDSVVEPEWQTGFCEDPPAAAPVVQTNSEGGRWSVALAEQWQSHEIVSSDSDLLSGLVASHRSLPVEAGLVVIPADDPERRPTDYPAFDILERFGEVGRRTGGGVFQNHEFNDAWTVEAELVLPDRVELRQLRNDMVIRTSQRVDVDTDYPYPTGSERRESEFHVRMTAIRRELTSGDVQEAYLFSLAPLSAWEAEADVRRALREFTDTTAFAEPDGAERVLDCKMGQRMVGAVDVLFLVDTTASTSQERVVAVLEEMATGLSNDTWDWRVGISVMNPDQPRPIGGWRTQPEALVADGQLAFDEYAGHGAGTATIRSVVNEMIDGGADDGFDKLAQKVIVVLSQGPDFSLSDMTEAERSNYVDETASLARQSTVLAGLGGGDCNGTAAWSYRELAERTGGAHDSICQPRVAVSDLFFTSGPSGQDITLPHTPISATIRVFTAEEELPRGEGGFRYSPSGNGIYVPWERIAAERGQPVPVAVVYERWEGNDD
jgi:hypothetical protein